MNQNGRSTLRQLATQISLCDGALHVWYLPYDPAMQQIIYRQVTAERPGGEDEYEPLELTIAKLQKEEQSEDTIAEIDRLSKEIFKIKSRYGNGFLSSYVVLDSCIVDVAMVDDSNIDAAALNYYWQTRNGDDPVGNFDLFRSILSEKFINELWTGYNDTRVKLPPAPTETQEDGPPENNPLERNGSQAKKGKRGKRPTKVVS